MERVRARPMAALPSGFPSRLSDLSSASSLLSSLGSASQGVTKLRRGRQPVAAQSGAPSALSSAAASSSRLSKQSSVSSSRRSRRKRKEDVARIIDERGRDVTPLPLTAAYGMLAAGGALLLPPAAGKQEEETAAAAVGAGRGELERAGGSGFSSWSQGDDDALMFSVSASAEPQPALPLPAAAEPTPIANESAAFASITLSETGTLTLFALPSLRFLTPPAAGAAAQQQTAAASSSAQSASASTAAPAVPSSSSSSASAVSTADGYSALLAAKKDRDRFCVGFAQTLNASVRDKAAQASGAETLSQALQCSTWQLWESEREGETEQADAQAEAGQQQAAAGDDDKREEEELMRAGEGGSAAGGRGQLSGGGDETARSQSSSASASSSSSRSSSSLRSAFSSQASTSTVAALAGQPGSSQAAGSAVNAAAAPQASSSPPRLQFSASFPSLLAAVEQAVLQNVHHAAQLHYRSIDAPQQQPAAAVSAASATGSSTVVVPSLVPLFSFSLPASLSSPLSCTSLSFNHANCDLLAVGYGSLQYASGLQPGLLLLWSFHNCAFPHRVLPTAASVLCLDFSPSSPHLLAVGLASGDVAVYDLRDRSTSSPSLLSRHSTGKHREAVWQVRWLRRDRGELLMSISSDGSVLQWSMKKGLTPRAIMSLKRGQESREGLSREASGMCFDFPTAASSSSSSSSSSASQSQYYCGTEDGLIHRCSVSYNEQVLDSYAHHTGAVYALRCSPFVPDVFLSCSHDWSTALWSGRLPERPICVMGGGATAATDSSDVMDAQWNPHNATVFALVTRAGRVEVWDVERSVLDPVITVAVAEGAGGQCLQWSRAGAGCVLMVGDDRGRVEALSMDGLLQAGREAATAEEEASRLEEVCYKHMQAAE